MVLIKRYDLTHCKVAIQSCGTNGCKKKVVELNNQYRCEKCDVTLDKYKYVLLMSVSLIRPFLYLSFF